ncbi:MAG: carbon-nitrogen hydrolase family protein [Candidatus Omnitrophota bacterium]|nr:carbon-nitrogen hydrolase family protein [Candidatus Omnitrophota bacterium]
MKVAVIQLNAGSDKEKNVERACSLVEKAARHHAQFVLLPEVFVFRGIQPPKTLWRDIAEPIPGPTIKRLASFARKHAIFILAGSIFEKSPIRGKVYNTSVFIDDKGKITGRYRKMNLFHAALGKKKFVESKIFLAGKKETMVVCDGLNVGLSICYDVRFPELYRTYGRLGADVLCVPSAFTSKTGQAHWEPLVRARAIENLCYVLAPNQIGKDNRGVKCFGHSLIVDPWGRVLARGSGGKEEILYAHLDKTAITQARMTLPSIRRK